MLKFLVEKNSNNAIHGQVTIGTLIFQVMICLPNKYIPVHICLCFYLFLHHRIFQDCAVGLLFALLPVLGGNSGILQGIASMGKVLVHLFLSINLCIHVLTHMFLLALTLFNAVQAGSILVVI